MDASVIALQAGIIGAGGAGFPTHVKLAAKADCFIINAAECEPLIEVDKFLIRTRAGDLVSGAADMAAAVGAARVLFAIKKAYAKEIGCLEAAIKKFAGNGNAPLSAPEISVFKLKSFYPAGDEQIITKLVTGRSVPERGIPLDVGAVVDNVATALNFYDAKRGRPVTRRVLSVTGAVKQPLMLSAPIGTPARLCVDAAGGAEEGSAIVMGGPMMGKFYPFSEIDSLFIKKTDGNILVLPPGHKLQMAAGMDIAAMRNRARAACIRCRMCTDLCPRYLTGHNVLPHVVMQNFYRLESLAESGDAAEFERAFGSAANCSECGLCENYACPMTLSPRRVNAYVKLRLSRMRVNPARNMNPEAREFFHERMAPTSRLTARLGLSRFAGHAGDGLLELAPGSVTLALKQHIGAPCEPLVAAGMKVSEGDLIGKIPDNKLGANLHASIGGTVASVGAEAITIANGSGCL